MTREEYYEALEKSKEFYHHGIKGQKWGVENGPPYPLDEAGKKKFAKNLEKNMKRGTYEGVKKSNERATKALNTLNKIDKSIYTDYNGWDRFNKAVESLGYSSIPYDEVTDAMWDQINAKVRSMK